MRPRLFYLGITDFRRGGFLAQFVSPTLLLLTENSNLGVFLVRGSRSIRSSPLLRRVKNPHLRIPNNDWNLPERYPLETLGVGHAYFFAGVDAPLAEPFPRVLLVYLRFVGLQGFHGSVHVGFHINKLI